MNGERAPRLVWKAGARHRVRLINITPDDIFSVALQTSEGPVHVDAGRQGRRAGAGGRVASPCPRARPLPLAKPTSSSIRRPQAARPRGWRCAPPGGKWQAQGHVIIK